MSKGSDHRAQAISMLNQVELKLIPLTVEDNNERISRLAKKILRVVEVSGRRKRKREEDGFNQVTLESELAM